MYYSYCIKNQTLPKMNLTSSSDISSGNSLIASTVHLLGFLTYLFESYLQIPNHSPKVCPSAIGKIGTLYSLHKALTRLTMSLLSQLSARTTTLAFYASTALQTSCSPFDNNPWCNDYYTAFLKVVVNSYYVAFSSAIIDIY